jgi:hypothetical protein
MLKLNSNLFEKDIIEKYSDVFEVNNQKMNEKMDLKACHSCLQMTKSSKMKTIFSEEVKDYENEVLNALVENLEAHNETYQFCTSYCWPEIIDFSIPKFSSLNNMALMDPPNEIKILNCYETILIQLAKSFQTIVKLSPLKQSSYFIGIQALKGKFQKIRFIIKIFNV